MSAYPEQFYAKKNGIITGWTFPLHFPEVDWGKLFQYNKRGVGPL